MKTSNTGKLVETAIMIALSFALSFISDLIPFLQLPFGGKVTLVSCLPLVYIGVRFGLRQGLFAGLIAGIIQLATGFIKHPTSLLMEHWYETVAMLLLDYLFAYALIGLSGLMKNAKAAPVKLAVGSVIGLTARYLCHILSGWIFFGQWAEWFFTDAETIGGATQLGEFAMSHFSGAGLAGLYSTVYNGLYMVPEIVVTAIVGALVGAIPVVAKRLSEK
ncbi:MAG: energy-coupled thiamine transporter ThiT [Clostridia bacterium]|nr:energy-coupled thiamine transporter ThiT [Clostridia bacterium]